MPRHEHTLNPEIAAVLDDMRRGWEINAEETGIFIDGGGRPDMVVQQQDRPAVLIENEFMPARNVEAEAIGRLGREMQNGDIIQTVIALRSPNELKQLKKSVADATFDYALFTGKDKDFAVRFPKNGWLGGSLADLSDFIYRASVPADVLKEAADSLEKGAQRASEQMNRAINFRTDIPKELATLLRQEYGNGEQTRRMAMLMIINAFVFHHNISGFQGIRPLSKIKRTLKGEMDGEDLANEWKKILEINYWPIFDIARQIIRMIPPVVLRYFLEILHKTALHLIDNGVVRSHDLSGRVFQKLIADRKYLATFYTRPASATLLANLSIPHNAPFVGGEWKNHANAYRIADFACGTGTLLAAAYQRVAELHEKQGGDMQKLHPQMMESALIGCDVMPAAVHLTASMLSGMYPAIKFNDTRLFTLVYGKTEGKTEQSDYATGSLELLAEQSIFTVFDTASSKQTGGGKKQAKVREIPWRTHNLVIMNPPFTRSTNHAGTHRKIPNPVWAGFGMNKKMQNALAKRSAILRKDTCAHGNAGIATDFVALADKMVGQDGITAFVLPLTAMAGKGWEKVRAMWARDYDEIRVFSLALPKIEECSFSADTGMAEILFIGKKINGRNGAARSKPRGVFVVLTKRPETEIESVEFARMINQVLRGEIHKLENGPVGETLIFLGNEKIGGAIDAPLPQSPGDPWGVARIRDLSLAQTAHALVQQRLWLPRDTAQRSLKMAICELGDFANRGLLDRDINGVYPDERPRGAFDIHPIHDSKDIPTYPCLFAHNAKIEQQMLIKPDSFGSVRLGEEDGAHKIWQTASRVFHNINFQFNSQSLSVATTNKPAIGGAAWTNIILSNREQEFAYALWSNSTLGLLLYWWSASKQQEGRGRISISRILRMPTLDLTQLSPAQLTAARRGFTRIKNKKLLPFYRANEDKTRAELDEIILMEVLNLPLKVLDGIAIVREKLCQEPSVRGDKPTTGAVPEA